MSRVITERVEITDKMLKPSKRLIDEDDLIKIIDKYYGADGCNGSDVAMDIMADISGLPPVEERKKGKWMKWEAQNGLTNGSECSECGYITSAVPNYGTNFCPNCGADMRGDGDA